LVVILVAGLQAFCTATTLLIFSKVVAAKKTEKMALRII